MAGTTSKTAAASKPKAEAKSTDEPKRTRTTLSPDEKVAKLEADLAAAREKAAEKKAKKHDELVEKRDKLQAKVDEQRKQIAELDEEIERTGPSGDPIVPIDDGGALSQVSGEEPADEDDSES